jgi:3-hydroxy-9,10-secoandrosta-1,3,5(10)-triene-9,17-dione monooxygenase
MTIVDVTAASPPSELSPAQALETARSLRARLADEQADTERRTRHSPETNDVLVGAGFYNMLRPRMFGGYEFTVTDFLTVIATLAEGDMSTAWGTCLGAGHNLQLASWFPEEVQREVYAEGHFSAPMTAQPGGTLRRTADGWTLTSRHGYCSGAPYATHFIGHAFVPGPEGTTGPGSMSTFLARRGSWTMLDDWGTTLGLKGSGSNTLTFDDVRLPANWVLEGRSQTDMDVAEPTPGLLLHGNPMYGGRAVGFFAAELAALMLGGVRAALREYEELLLTKRTVRAPFVLRAEDPSYQEWFGLATAKLAAAEAVLWGATDRYMEVCERAARGGEPFTEQDDVLISMMGRESLLMAWSVMEGIVFRSAGSSAAVDGTRLERIWRDTSMAFGHVNTNLQSWMARRYTTLTVPRS